MVFARWEAQAASLHEDGSPVISHWRVAAKRGDPKILAKLYGPPFPEALRDVYEEYRELAQGRRYGMNGPEPLCYVDIDAWARLKGVLPNPQRVAAFLTLDRNVLDEIRNPGKHPATEDMSSWT